MNSLIGLITFLFLMMIFLGIYYHINPPRDNNSKRSKILKSSVGINLIIFVGAQAGLLFFAFQDVLASPVAAETVINEISIGKGLAFIGIALPTCFATLGAGIAVAPIGSSSLAAITEKPEIFGRSLIYLGLAEGIAIYGLVATILLLNRL